MRVLSFSLLGPVEVRAGDRLVPLAGPKQRTILTVLLLAEGRPVSTDRLAEVLWGDELPSDPAAAVRSQLTRLRRALGPDAGLVTTERGYQLTVEHTDLDTTRFEALLSRAAVNAPEVSLGLLDEALALWRGPLEIADIPAAVAEAARLEELWLGAREQQAELLAGVGDVDGALVALEALVADAPERERARALHMETLYRAGRHSEALSGYRAWRAWLADEQGLDPSPALQDLERAILRHQLSPPTRVAGSAAQLPRPITTFFGRDADVTELCALVGPSRLVSLVGFGGVGKSRLAVEAASALEPRYDGQVRWCDVSAVRRPAAVARCLAAAVGVELRAARRLEDQLVEQLGALRLLLVLDGCEHVREAVARLAREILERTRTVDVLVTSRERLGLTGEHVWAVGPLSTEGEGAAAVQLFLDRACAVNPVVTHELRGVQQLCAQLDGLPLAIELAAARAGSLTVSELSASLRPSLDPPGPRGPGRHDSLRAVVDWSVALLTPHERQVLVELSVFAGSFSLAAAQAVCSEPDDVVTDAVLRLVDCSLVTARPQGTVTRYSLLDTIRRYGWARLADQGLLEEVRDRHADWALTLTSRAARALETDEEPTWVGVLDECLADLRDVHGWLVERNAARSLALLDQLHSYALWRNRSEVFRWAEVAVAAAGTERSPLLASVQASAALGAAWRGDLRGAAQAAVSARGVATATGSDAAALLRTDQAASEVALLSGDLERAIALYDETTQLATGSGALVDAVWSTGSAALAHAWAGRPDEADAAASTALAWAEKSRCPSALAFAHYAIGEVLMARDPSRAAGELCQAIELAGQVDGRLVIGLAHVSLATLHSRHERNSEVALAYYQEAVLEWQRARSWTSLWVTVRTLVELLTRLGRLHDAAVLYGGVTAGSAGAPPFGEDAERLRADEVTLRRELGDAAYQRAIAEGAAMDVEHLVAYALTAVAAARG